ncbi:helix-turn-helix domain-containing protein [Tunturiibacter empetritectus]|uniref:AraC-like DNA-binding protein n=2 Tax=Tunturiibacter TaxID=3154218 RepID=A0A852VLP9_9BACT|nr:helix-turn-helix domain-containing protein [Edaphobacter lichenicola]NYF91344.1 AraC-like DNA-binding protein [Edaphobacter lichenicola]
MLYLEHIPHPVLAPFVKALWYVRDPRATHRHERVLPTGRAQIVLSLARDHLTDANNFANPLNHSPAGIFLGIYSRYQQIDAIDFTELIGVVFHPGGTAAFFPDNAHVFTNSETALSDLWGRAADNLRNELREAPTPKQKFALLEFALLTRLSLSRQQRRDPILHYALTHLDASPGTTTIAELTRTTGLSPRRLSERFNQHIGISPKLYCRIQRFQQAIQQMHRGADIPWAELALACGYYDQSHFANDFRAFSGLSATDYSTTNRIWANHIPLD